MDEESMDTTTAYDGGDISFTDRPMSDSPHEPDQEVNGTEFSIPNSSVLLTGRFGDGPLPLLRSSPSSCRSSPHSTDSTHTLSQSSSKDITQGACGGSDVDSGNSFGRGWWKNGDSSKAKKQKVADSDSGKDFGSGWWKKSSSSSSESQSQSKRRNSTEQCHQQHSAEKRVRNEDGHSFGAGWWKGKIESHASDTSGDCSKLRGASTQLTHRQQVRKPDKILTDIVPYRIRTNPVMVTQFMEQVMSIKQEIMEEEEFHGRTVSLTLGSVPGVWKASLGGSKCSLLVQIQSVPKRSSAKSKHYITVMDIKGHTASVFLAFLTSSQKYPPHCQSGVFVLLQAVHWHEQSSGKLCIKMEDSSRVMFGIQQ